uniref:Uncharacterized protein n=1 Tax=viral metagenome TaxID=1070528 RepID=A0A6C0B7J3_9ZZZZ
MAGFNHNPLNYLRNKDRDTIAWNKKLNREDIIHDSPGLTRNTLFQSCLNDFPNEGKAEPVEAHLRVVLPGKEFKKPPEQLKNIKESIPDTYPGKKLGLTDRISPSFYFDPASRKFTGRFSELETFLEEQDLQGKRINLSQYGIDNIYYVVNIKNECMVFEFYFSDSKKKNFTVTIDKDGYVITSPDDGETPNPSYVSGNEVKKAFFTVNNDSQKREIIEDGFRLIFCKLLGDLSHVIYSDDKTAVFTNDTYLRDRCIKNKCPAIYREPLTKGSLKKGGGKSKKVVKVSGKSVKPLNMISTYVLHDIYRRAINGGGTGKSSKVAFEEKFANNCNKMNLLKEIKEIVSRIETFLNKQQRSFKINGRDFECTTIIETKLKSIIDFLDGEVLEKKIDEIDTSLSVEEYNSLIMRWFPLQILFCPEDMNTSMYTYEGDTYYSPLNVDRLFPEQEDKIGDFNNVFEKGSFKKFVMNGIIDETKNKRGSLNNILSFLSREFGISTEFEKPVVTTVLRKSDELDQAKELLLKLKDQVSISDDLAELVDYAIDFGVLTEHDIAIEYLKDICGDDIEAQSYYTRLLPLVYFDGYHVYDYDLLKAFVKLCEAGKAPRGNDGFLEFLAEKMKKDEEVEPESDEEVEPESDEEVEPESDEEVEPESPFEIEKTPIQQKPVSEPEISNVFGFKDNFNFKTIASRPRKGSKVPGTVSIFRAVHGGSRKTLKKRRTKRAKKSNKKSKRIYRKH